MKLMILASRVPWPLDKGDKLRMFHQIKELSRFHEIHLLALSEQGEHPEAEIELSKYCHEIHFFHLSRFGIAKGMISAFFSGKPLQVGYFYNQKVEKKIQKLILQIQPDHIYGQLVRVAEYFNSYEIPKTLDLQDALSEGLKRRSELSHFPFRLILKMEYRRMKKYESDSLNNFDFLTIITQTDKELLSDSIRERVSVIPNGVDLEYFSPQDVKKQYDVVFTGNMNYPPNIMAAKYLVKEIMPLVWNKFPLATVLLAGSSPHISVKNLANNQVFVSGWMDDIRNAYAQSKIFIAPMQIGTGLQNKLLEAMAMQIPCITSDLANNALHAQPDVEILVSKKEDAQSFANQIIKLINEKESALQIAKLGHQFVHSNYHWKSTIDRLTEIWKAKN